MGRASMDFIWQREAVRNAAMRGSETEESGQLSFKLEVRAKLKETMTDGKLNFSGFRHPADRQARKVSDTNAHPHPCPLPRGEGEASPVARASGAAESGVCGWRPYPGASNPRW